MPRLGSWPMHVCRKLVRGPFNHFSIKGDRTRSIGYCPHLWTSPLQTIHHSQQSHCLSHTQRLCCADWIGCSWNFHRCGQYPMDLLRLPFSKKAQFHSVHHLSIWTEYYYLSECTLTILQTEEATMRRTALICLQKYRQFCYAWENEKDCRNVSSGNNYNTQLACNIIQEMTKIAPYLYN